MAGCFDYVSSFRQTYPYIKAYRGKTFVMMLPGAAIHHHNFANIVHDISLLNNLGVRIVLVHGIQEPEGNHSTHSPTDAANLKCLIETVGSTRFAIEAALSTGLPGSPMHNADLQVRSGNFVTAMPQGIVNGVDLQYTGKVRKIDIPGLDDILFSGAIVLVSPLGHSATGETFRLTCTEVAMRIAIELTADKLIAFTKENGVPNESGELQKQLTLLQCKKLLLKKPVTDSYLSLQACYNACDEGVNRAQIISYAQDGALIQELFTRDGVGTMVYRDSYETIRRARIDDIGGILDLIEPLEVKGILVRRSRELLEREIGHFTVMELDGTIIACSALYPFVKNNTGELACMVTHPDYRQQGKAAKLLSHIEKQAGKLKMTQLFVLTTQTAHWFIEQGFIESSLQILPQEKQTVYNYHRNAKIFLKTLS